MAEASVRRSQIVQQEAREMLNRFLIACSELIPRDKKKHFGSDYPVTSRMAETERKELTKVAHEIGKTKGETRKILEHIAHKDLHYTDAFMRILQATAERQIPVQSDLDVLKDALNLQFTSLMYFRSAGRRIKLPCPPYAQEGKSTIRQAAEALLHYLNMTDAPGPVHASCQVCRLLMIRKRGGRKYCSATCSRKAWNYEARKDKLAQNRKLHREFAAHALLAAKAKTSRKSGK